MDNGLLGTGRRIKDRWNKWWTFAALSLFAAFVGLLVISLVYSYAGTVPFGYGVVFDTGSTHTEMLLYRWKGEKWRDTGIVEEINTCDMSGGMGENFKADPQGVQAYLDTCLKLAVSAIPEKERSDSPVYLAATAGLRMLQLDQPEIVDQILGNASVKLASSELKFTRENAYVITGQQEAVAGWITVNFLSNKLLPGDKPHKLGSMLGALDMGGASTQITFELGPEPRVTEALKLYGQGYNLYATSYMCHGIAQIIKRHQMSLYMNVAATPPNIQDNPCLAKTHSVSYSPLLMINPCCNTSYASKFDQFSFQGTSNGTMCLEQIRKVISPDFCKSTFLHSNCLDVPPPPRPANTTFVGFSTFYYIAVGYNLTDRDNVTDFLDRVLTVCNLDQAQLNETTFPEVSPKYKKDMCYMGLYMYVLLNDIYRFTPNEWKRTFYAKSIQNATVGWALGFMTQSTNAIPPETAEPGIPVPWFVILTLMFVSLVGVALWLGKKANKNSRLVHMTQTHPTSYGAVS